MNSLAPEMATVLPVAFLGGSLGPWEVFIIVLAVLMLFGSDRLPELMRGMGKTVEKMRRAMDEVRYQILVVPEENDRRKKDYALPTSIPGRDQEPAPPGSGGQTSLPAASSPPATDSTVTEQESRNAPPGKGTADELGR